MNTYHPYEIVTDTAECFHLKAGEIKERMHFTVSTVIPLLLILSGWFILQQLARNIPMGWNYLLVAVILIVAAYLFLQPFITAVTVTQEKIIITKKAGISKSAIIEANKIKAIKLVQANNADTATIILYADNKDHLLIKSIDAATAAVIQQKMQRVLMLYN